MAKDIKKEIIAELDRRMDLLREHQYDQIEITGNEYSELNQALSKVIGAPLLEELGDIKAFKCGEGAEGTGRSCSGFLFSFWIGRALEQKFLWKYFME